MWPSGLRQWTARADTDSHHTPLTFDSLRLEWADEVRLSWSMRFDSASLHPWGVFRFSPIRPSTMNIALTCSEHGYEYEDGCAGCEEAEYWFIAGLVTDRITNDTGERLSIEELAESLGIDLDEIDS